MRLIAVIVAATLVGCASSGIVQVGEDTYKIERSDKAGIFGNAVQVREEVLHEADAFAASHGKKAERVMLNETPVRVGRFAKVEYTFRLVDPEPNEASQLSSAEAGDLYTEILKLDDLRNRGLITDEEYESEKRELLEQY